MAHIRKKLQVYIIYIASMVDKSLLSKCWHYSIATVELLKLCRPCNMSSSYVICPLVTVCRPCNMSFFNVDIVNKVHICKLLKCYHSCS